MIKKRTMVPDNNRITVKLDASIASFSNANRHNTELAANAINASPVKAIIFSKELLIITNPILFGSTRG